MHALLHATNESHSIKSDFLTWYFKQRQIKHVSSTRRPTDQVPTSLRLF